MTDLVQTYTHKQILFKYEVVIDLLHVNVIECYNTRLFELKLILRRKYASWMNLTHLMNKSHAVLGKDIMFWSKKVFRWTD
jgi:hypothetical protein